MLILCTKPFVSMPLHSISTSTFRVFDACDLQSQNGVHRLLLLVTRPTRVCTERYSAASISRCWRVDETACSGTGWPLLVSYCLALPVSTTQTVRVLSLSLLLSIYPYPRAKRHSQPSFSACLLCTLCLDRVCATGDGVGVIIIWVSFGIQFAIFRDEDRFGILRYSVASESLNSVCCSCCVWFRIRNFYVAYASRASRFSSSYSCLRFRVRLSVFYCWFFWVVDEQQYVMYFHLNFLQWFVLLHCYIPAEQSPSPQCIWNIFVVRWNWGIS